MEERRSGGKEERGGEGRGEVRRGWGWEKKGKEGEQE